MSAQGVGASLVRKEDDRLMRGRGQFVADIRLAGMKDVAFVRSPVAHARIRGITIPPEHRAAVMSAFYIVAYAAISVPAILAVSLVSAWGLQSTFEVFGLVIAGLALVVAFEAWRTRPASPRLAVARV